MLSMTRHSQARPLAAARLLSLFLAAFPCLFRAAAQAHARPSSSSGSGSGIPASFDARSLVFGCADTVMDQQHCGSCWAFAVTGALSDRYCIWSGGRLFAHDVDDDSATLSPQPLLSCGEGDLACNGTVRAD